MSDKTTKFKNPIPETIRDQFSLAGLQAALLARLMFSGNDQAKKEASEQPNHIIMLTLPEYETPQQFLDTLNAAQAARRANQSLNGLMVIASSALEKGRKEAERLVAGPPPTGTEATLRKIVDSGSMKSGDREIKPHEGHD